MSNCVKTGARVFIQELGAVYSADIYSVGSAALVIRFNPLAAVTVPVRAQDVAGFGTVLVPTDPNSHTHFAYMANFSKGDWLREDLGVLVLQRSHLAGPLCDD